MRALCVATFTQPVKSTVWQTKSNIDTKQWQTEKRRKAHLVYQFLLLNFLVYATKAKQAAALQDTRNRNACMPRYLIRLLFCAIKIFWLFRCCLLSKLNWIVILTAHCALCSAVPHCMLIAPNIKRTCACLCTHRNASREQLRLKCALHRTAFNFMS